MRTQRRAPLRVTLKGINAETDALGEGDPTTRWTCVVDGATFEPAQTLERVGGDRTPVLQQAAFNVPGCHEMTSNDEVICGTETWYVQGKSDIWLDRTNIPVSQTRAT